MTTPIEILEEMIKNPFNSFSWQYDLLKEAKERIEKDCIRDAHTHINMRWISTSIQLPPEDTNVLVWEWWQSNLSWWNEPKIGWYNKKFWFQSHTDYLIATHWMPLPIPPNQ